MMTLTIEDTQYRNEVLKMAKEAGLRQHIPFWSDSEVAVALEAFAKLVAEKSASVEREACAQLCEWYSISKRANINYSEECAQAIRSRGKSALKDET
jgi:hypothetical protein